MEIFNPCYDEKLLLTQHQNVYFHAQAEYSYFSADFRLKIFIIHS